MASVNTNAAAITALRTLQNTNASMDKTQQRISTGYKIGEAKDNAAYWAISTTLKSDNKSLATVKDALGLGASTVDTAYQGLNKAKDVLDEIKSKLTAATQDGVDRDTIQNEIKQLQDQLKSIATSSVFSGENWLSTDTSAVSYNANKQVVASFSRDASGAVNIGTIGVDISKVALFDASTAANTGGIIDGAVNLKGKDGRDLAIGGTDVITGNNSVAGLTATAAGGVSGADSAAGVAVTATGAALGTPASQSTAKYLAGDITAATNGTNDATHGLEAGQTVTIAFGAAGAAGTATLTVTSAMVTHGKLTYADLATATLAGGASITIGSDGSSGLLITNTANGSTAAPAITAITVTPASGSPAVTSGNQPTYAAPTTPSGGNIFTGSAGTKANVSSSALTVTDFAVGDKISATVNIGGTDRAITTAALTGTGAGGAIQLSDIVGALNTAFSAYGAVTSPSSTILKFEATAVGTVANFDLKALTAVNSANVGKVITNGIGTPPVAAKQQSGSFSAITLDADDNLYFKVQVDDATAATNVTINKELIDKTLTGAGHVAGKIATVDEYKTVIQAALKAVNLDTKITVSTSGTGGAGGTPDKITLASNTIGAASKLAITDVAASQGGDKVSLADMDISATGLAKVGATSSDQIKQVLTAYIDAVNTAITKVTSAAASLGSVASRIDLQKSFVDTLMDTIDKGVGNLIDADMSEESTKLQALQVKQQLGVQALSIANQASQSILSLFRS